MFIDATPKEAEPPRPRGANLSQAAANLATCQKVEKDLLRFIGYIDALALTKCWNGDDLLATLTEGWGTEPTLCVNTKRPTT